MASSSAAATDLLITQSKDETSLPAESKELTVTMTTVGQQPHVRAEVPSNNGDTDTPLPVRAEEEEEEEATPTPPESSSLSSDIETATVATTEEESLLVLLRHIKTGRLVDQGGEPGKGPDQGQDGGLVQVLDFVVDQPVLS